MARRHDGHVPLLDELVHPGLVQLQLEARLVQYLILQLADAEGQKRPVSPRTLELSVVFKSGINDIHGDNAIALFASS